MKHKFNSYCKDIENVENYDKAAADNFKGWHCHHRRGVDISRKELIELGAYYNVPAEELLFLTISEHRTLHNKGRKFSAETREKLSEAAKNRSEEHRNKLGLAHKGKLHSEETKKRISESSKGRHISEETKNKMSEAKRGNTATKNMCWFNNGQINVRRYECPPGYSVGRLKRK
jgi:hypothetical protein